MALWQWLGELHPKLVQFPLVLCLAGLGFDLWGWLRRSDRAHWAGLCLTAAGTFGLLFTFICGIYAEISAGRAGISQHPIELHELLATFAAWGLVLLLAWRIFLVNRQPAPRGIQNGTGDPGELPPAARKRGWMAFYLAVGFFSYGLLVLTAYLGGQLVFQYGAGVSAIIWWPCSCRMRW